MVKILTMFRTLFRSKKRKLEDAIRGKESLRIVESDIKGRIEKLERRLHELELKKEELVAWIEDQAIKQGYGDADNFLRVTSVPSYSECIDEIVSIEREKIGLESKLIEVQQKIKESIFQ